MGRRIAAFFLAPAAVPLLMVLVGAVLWLFDAPPSRGFLVGSTWVYFFTLPAAFVLGIPAIFLFKLKGWSSLRAYAFGGAVIGAISTLCLFVFLPFGFNYPVALALFVLVGAASASVYWLICVRHHGP